ncbi:MAG: phosphodiester glycosidase family protein, partial [Paracoccaceae bacterium]
LPNGVFCISEGRARVIETRRFAAEAPACRYATQSGPMLVLDGALHPRFLPDSSSRFIRNGVGTDDAGERVVFAISEQPVSFDEFGRLFRDVLGLRQALYLDGSVSRLHAPALGRSDFGRAMGPVVGVVASDD